MKWNRLVRALLGRVPKIEEYRASWHKKKTDGCLTQLRCFNQLLKEIKSFKAKVGVQQAKLITSAVFAALDEFEQCIVSVRDPAMPFSDLPWCVRQFKGYGTVDFQFEGKQLGDRSVIGMFLDWAVNLHSSDLGDDIDEIRPFMSSLADKF